MNGKSPITATRSLDGKIHIVAEFKSSSWSPHISVRASDSITIAQARTLAADLARLADETEAKLAKAAAAEDRRRKWREREIAAGRIRVMSLQEMFGNNMLDSVVATSRLGVAPTTALKIRN